MLNVAILSNDREDDRINAIKSKVMLFGYSVKDAILPYDLNENTDIESIKDYLKYNEIKMVIVINGTANNDVIDLIYDACDTLGILIVRVLNKC